MKETKYLTDSRVVNYFINIIAYFSIIISSENLENLL